MILICILDYKAIYSIFEPAVSRATAFLQGKTIINLTTGTPAEARGMDQWVREHGAARYFGGSIMVEPAAIGTPSSLIFCGGESEASFEESGAEKILSNLGVPVYFGSGPDDAETHNMAMLAALAGMFNGVLLSLSLMKKQLDRRPKTAGKMSLQTIVTQYLNPFLQAMMPYHVKFAEALDQGDPTRNDGITLEVTGTVASTIIRTYKEEGVDKGAIDHFNQLMWRGVKEHGRDCGLSQMVYSLMNDDGQI